jgi:hypothetical protein
MIRTMLILLTPLALVACNNASVVAPDNTVPPPLESIRDAPGDWSRLSGAVGRRPAESALLINSAITVDLNSMLGADASAFRTALADAGELRPEAGGILVTRSASGRGWLVIQPDDHAIAAGLKRGERWRVYRTPGSNIPLPVDLPGVSGA